MCSPTTTNGEQAARGALPTDPRRTGSHTQEYAELPHEWMFSRPQQKQERPALPFL